MYTMILPVENAKLFVDQIFRIFDKDGNGSIDFKVCWKFANVLQKLNRNYSVKPKMVYWIESPLLFLLQEFMMATDMTASGSPEEKLRY